MVRVSGGDGGVLFSLTSWYSIVGIIGCLLWIVAYGFVVVVGFKDKAHGIPGPAICLNLAWEFLACFVWPDTVKAWWYLDISWFVVDLIIMGQFLYYGRGLQKNAFIRRYFYPLVAGGLALSFLAQYAFSWRVTDKVGMFTAFADNQVMSILFIPLYYSRRPKLAGLSWGAAWTKMVGTVGTAVMGYFLFKVIFPRKEAHHVLERHTVPIYVGIFVADIAYLYLLWKGRRALVESSLAPDGAAGPIPSQPSADSAASSLVK
jgi:hypothetical protein